MTRQAETGSRVGEGGRLRSFRLRHVLAALVVSALFAHHVAAQSPPMGSPSQPASQPALESPPAADPKRRERLDLRGPDVGFPGIGRVLLGFGLCAALALGATLLLRRYWPAAGFIKGNSEVGGIRVVGRARVEASLRLSVVETAGTRVLIAESRNGVAAVVLAPGASQTGADATRTSGPP